MSRERDVAIARGLGNNVYLMPVVSGYENIAEEDSDELFIFDPIYEIVPVIMLEGCVFEWHNIVDGKMQYNLNIVPNYDQDYKELHYLCSVELKDRGWVLHNLCEHSDTEWSCTYVNLESQERIMTTGKDELDARAACACTILNGDDWPSHYEEPQLIAYLPANLMPTPPSGDDQNDE